MKKNTHFSIEIPVFHGRSLPEEGVIVGYAAIIERLKLPCPMPTVLSVVSKKNKKYETKGWRVFTPPYQPEETLYKQLVFAIKYEGIDLLFFKKLFEKLTNEEVLNILRLEPTGQYSRRIWFLYEWLKGEKLDIPDLSIKQAVPLLDVQVQYAVSGTSSPRHRIINNLPGTPNFCPLVRKTKKIADYITSDISSQQKNYLKGINGELILRASAFLLLKDSKASFTIEGESPKSKRTARWGRAIGQAGKQPLTKNELLRLQQLVIENPRFLLMGFRNQGGFIGEHDRSTHEPLPEHISARWIDVEQLVEGLIDTSQLLLDSEYDAVLTAASIAFGFVFIHPFVDGNGRIHRYIIHHILARKRFSKQGIIFPVSASILDHIDDYRKVLEGYSHPLLDFIEWKPTKNNNVEVLNDTIDYYRYFDATTQCEFLFDCVDDTVKNIIPNEVSYLKQFDTFKRYIDNEFEMPDRMVSTLVRFLEQNEGRLSKRAKSKEFKKLAAQEILEIEAMYKEIFLLE